MKGRVRSIGVFARLALVLAVAGDASAWVVRDQPPAGQSRFGQAIALGPDGNPVVAGWYYGPTAVGQDFRAAKYAAADGALLWSFGTGGLPAGSTATAYLVQVDANGDAVVGGTAYTNADVYDSIIVKLSGVDGSVLWRRDLAGPDYQSVRNIALTSDGDVVATVDEGPFFTAHPVVHRLDGTTGADEWTTPIQGTSGAARAFGLAVDAADDVLVGGEVGMVGGTEIVVAKLAAADGAEIWRSTIPNGGVIASIAIDALGDVVAAGYQDAAEPGNYQTLVVKYAGTTGAFMWEYDLVPDELSGAANVVRIDAAGDVVLAGMHQYEFLAAKLNGSTGAELWRRVLSGKGFPQAYALAISSAGSALVGGHLDNRFTVASFASSNGATQWVEQLPGTADDWGYVLGATLGSGYIFATGSSVYPLGGHVDRPGALTVVRYIDPDAPPVIGNCTPAPRGDCRTSIQLGKGKLSLKDLPGARADRLQWKLTKGEATTLADFGDPQTAGNDYSLCLYDGTNARIFSVAVPGGGTCGTIPCWVPAGSASLLYRSARPREPEGLDKLKLTSGGAGAMKVATTRKGRSNLDIPGPTVAGLTLPLVIQLQQDGGNCFTSTFSAGGVLKNDGVTFKAVSN